MEDQLNRFLQLFLSALDAVEQSYYETAYHSVEAIRMAFSLYEQRNFVNGDYYRTGERIFCYELYHQLRNLLDAEREQNDNFLPNTFLQAEVKKMQVLDLLGKFGLDALSKNFIPDFLMHTPGNADLHPYVIEVKANARIRYNDLFDDISKIAEFIIRYNYQRGIFLSVTTDDKYLFDTITSCELIRRNGDINEVSDRIYVINKSSAEVANSFFTLNQLLPK